MEEGFAARAAWTAAAELLRAEGCLSDSQAAFLNLAKPIATVDEIFMISVGSDFIKDWLQEHVIEAMTPQLSNILGRTVKILISVDPALSEQEVPTSNTDTLSASFTSPHPSTPLQSVTSPVFSEELKKPELHSVNYSPVDNSLTSLEEKMRSYHGNSSYSASSYPEDFSSSPQNESNTDTSSPAAFPTALPKLPNGSQGQEAARLNPRHTFENFVIGESNRFAHATALAVAESPGSTYNPLFLYSASGMGKTHLLHAIGNYTLSLYPGLKVLYTSAEEFTNAFINALSNNERYTFKDRFRNVDVLLIDDIQFISGRENTLEEFFHTFNSLSNANKQIVITSDVAPKYLTGFEERMISRFASGITANIDLPNFETRIAILEKKAAAESLTVPRAVLEFIASRITTNVREMEGALRRITAYGGLAQQEITLDMAEMVLKDIISDPDSIQISAGMIMAETALYFDLTTADLKSPTRTRALTTPRHIGMYLCRELTNLSLPQIADAFNRRDHTTVINAVKKVEKQMAEKQNIFNEVSELTTRIKQAAKTQAQQVENYK